MTAKKNDATPKAAPKRAAQAKKTPAAKKPAGKVSTTRTASAKKSATKKPAAAPDMAKDARPEYLRPEDLRAEELVLDVEVTEARGFDAPERERPAPERLTPDRRELFRAWWKAARPPFYIATLVPLLLGYFAARNDVGSPSLLVLAGVLLVGFLLHLAANLANDLYDYLLGTDTQESIGGSRCLQSGSISVGQLRVALMGCYAATAFFTALGVWITGLWGLVPVALFGALASYFYVAPPLMYGYKALGELMVFLSMGLAMTGGSYYALAGHMEPYVLALSIPVGLMVAGILYYQSLPEIETDAAMGKKTLAGLLGPEKAVFCFKLWWPLIWLLIVTLWLAGLMAWPALLGVIAGIPLHKTVCDKVDDFGGDWLSLDRHGKYVRLMYLAAGLFMLLGVALN